MLQLVNVHLLNISRQRHLSTTVQFTKITRDEYQSCNTDVSFDMNGPEEPEEPQIRVKVVSRLTASGCGALSQWTSHAADMWTQVQAHLGAEREFTHRGYEKERLLKY